MHQLTCQADLLLFPCSSVQTAAAGMRLRCRALPDGAGWRASAANHRDRLPIGATMTRSYCLPLSGFFRALPCGSRAASATGRVASAPSLSPAAYTASTISHTPGVLMNSRRSSETDVCGPAALRRPEAAVPAATLPVTVSHLATCSYLQAKRGMASVRGLL
jgi:hypothetical protein